DDLLKTRSHAMTKKAVQALSSIINEAMRRGLVAQNVAKGVNTGKKKGRTARVVIPERSELRAMIKVCQDGELALILTFIFTGIRASEFRGLPWRDVDLSANELRVSQRADQWCQIGPPKSDAGYRTIPLPDVVVTALRRWKLACPPSTLDLVFPSGAGTPFGYQNLLRRVFFPIQIRAGITRPVTGKGGKPKRDADGNPMVNGKYGFHALRHAAASGWIDQNIDLKRLQTWMGHESIQITLDTYGHLISDKAKDAAIASEAERALFS
ncbi:MAG: site-specific integrase, partial [Pseudomonadota bacterium]